MPREEVVAAAETLNRTLQRTGGAGHRAGLGAQPGQTLLKSLFVAEERTLALCRSPQGARDRGEAIHWWRGAPWAEGDYFHRVPEPRMTRVYGEETPSQGRTGD